MQRRIQFINKANLFDWILRFAQDDEKEALDDEEKKVQYGGEKGM